MGLLGKIRKIVRSIKKFISRGKKRISRVIGRVSRAIRKRLGGVARRVITGIRARIKVGRRAHKKVITRTKNAIRGRVNRVYRKIERGRRDVSGSIRRTQKYVERKLKKTRGIPQQILNSVKSIWDKLKKIKGNITEAIKTGIIAMTKHLSAVKKWLGSRIAETTEFVGKKMNIAINEIRDNLIKMIAWVTRHLREVIGFVKNTIKETIDMLSRKIHRITEILKTSFMALIPILVEITKGITSLGNIIEKALEIKPEEFIDTYIDVAKAISKYKF